jgi:hypothetical protein
MMITNVILAVLLLAQTVPSLGADDAKVSEAPGAESHQLVDAATLGEDIAKLKSSYKEALAGVSTSRRHILELVTYLSELDEFLIEGSNEEKWLAPFMEACRRVQSCDDNVRKQMGLIHECACSLERHYRAKARYFTLYATFASSPKAWNSAADNCIRIAEQARAVAAVQKPATLGPARNEIDKWISDFDRLRSLIADNKAMLSTVGPGQSSYSQGIRREIDLHKELVETRRRLTHAHPFFNYRSALVEWTDKRILPTAGSTRAEGLLLCAVDLNQVEPEASLALEGSSIEVMRLRKEITELTKDYRQAHRRRGCPVRS